MCPRSGGVADAAPRVGPHVRPVRLLKRDCCLEFLFCPNCELGGYAGHRVRLDDVPADGRIPLDWRMERTRVRWDRSRARDKVEQGGARCTTSRHLRYFFRCGIVPRLFVSLTRRRSASFSRSTSAAFRKFVPPVEASSAVRVRRSAAFTALVRPPLPAKSSKKRMLRRSGTLVLRSRRLALLRSPAASVEGRGRLVLSFLAPSVISASSVVGSAPILLAGVVLRGGQVEDDGCRGCA